MATSPTIPMYAPDGTLGDIPYERMHDALAAGGKLGVNMLAPDGTKGVIPSDRVGEAQKAGGKVVPFNFEDADGAKPGFWATFKGDLASLIPRGDKNAKPQPSPAGSKAADIADYSMGGSGAVAIGNQMAAEDVEREKAGYGPLYRLGAQVAGAVGTNVTGMEQAAKEGNQGAVLGHMAAGQTIAAAPSAVRGASELVGKGIEALPSTSRAGAAFQDLSKTIGEHPVSVTDDLSKSLNALRKATTTTNTNIPPAVRKLIDRLDPFQGMGPLSYDEARAFSSEINQLSASDKMSMTPNTHRLVADLNQKLKATVQNTAELAGKGQQLAGAMKEYRNAMTLNGMTDAAKENALKALITGALSGLGIAGAKKIWDAVSPR